MTYTGKRGMSFENTITYANNVYLNKGVAVINKRPTPVKVTKSKGTRVLSGFFEEKSTVDFDGVYKGRAIYFEAKSTKNDTRFDLKNIHKHQVDYMYETQKAGALCFFLIEFRGAREVFLVPFDFIHHYVVNADRGGRKSIPREDFNYYSAGLVEAKNGVPLDYLSIVEALLCQSDRQ
ncbi:Holliday junction resolvase RecU [Sediminibacillus terrae]|uniref:Holliday junction resolvase RecU n=1 Tax=Sediminibacillus terrae TaxID=1562106 RepID=UPI0012982211|nr:Holliday junction resolvase RecU [Sediminibacillus terrae]